ncbi:Hypothetical protein PHPALM_12699 [Phytophthora palmivora]|uniref:Uncharacterized protein n=1 Tax=Phytophthora palmivora TaxID=4796 RepID=A0A2P4XZ36_9STRA|nr:Hypothetical protein PHPALM_12699 [Phytophthora palmivora]
MQLHGQPVFDVYAKPIVSTDRSSLRYDGFATFLQDDLEFTYMVVEGVAYVVKSSIGDNEQSTTHRLYSVPAGLLHDSAVSNVCGQGLQTCITLQFDGQNFFVCGFEGEGFIAFGEDLKVTVEYLDTPLRKISIPSNNNTSCAVVMPAATVMPTTLALLSGGTVST